MVRGEKGRPGALVGGLGIGSGGGVTGGVGGLVGVVGTKTLRLPYYLYLLFIHDFVFIPTPLLPMYARVCLPLTV